MGQLSHRPGSHPAATGDRPRFIRDGWHQHHPCTHAKGLVQVSSCCSQDTRHRALAVAWPLAHPMGWGLQGSFHLPRALGPSRGSKHSLSFSDSGSQPLGPPGAPTTPSTVPFPCTCCSQAVGNGSGDRALRGCGLHIHPVGSLTSPTHQTPQWAPLGLDLCSAGKEETSRRWAVGFYFILSKYL